VDLLRAWNAITRFYQGGFRFLPYNVHAKFDAFVADKNSWTCNELAHFMLALPTEGTVEGVFPVTTAFTANFAHTNSTSCPIRTLFGFILL